MSLLGRWMRRCMVSVVGSGAAAIVIVGIGRAGSATSFVGAVSLRIGGWVMW